jgi:predicted O-methyltransferase YrrM
MSPEVHRTLARLYDADAAQRALDLPSEQRTRNIERASGHFLHLLALAMRAQAVLEIGSSNGASTIWLAAAVMEHGGQVTGTELIPERAEDANANLREAGLADFGQVLPGDARQTIQGLVGPFDLVFIDAEKDDYVAHVEAALPLLRPGGVVVADNVVSHDLSAYQTYLRDHPQIETVTLPVGRGLEFSVKRVSPTS